MLHVVTASIRTRAPAVGAFVLVTSLVISGLGALALDSGTSGPSTVGGDRPVSSGATTFDSPGLTLSPSSGPEGTEVTANATGFSAGEAVEVDWQTVLYAECQADSQGACSARFAVPTTYGGQHAVEAVGYSSGLETSAPFVVTPSLTLDPDSGPAGTASRAKGTGFLPNETVDVYWAGTLECSGVAEPNLSGSEGSFSCGFSVPPDSGGLHNVTAIGAGGDTAAATFDVGASFTVAPRSAPVGASVVAHGVDFGAGQNVTLQWTCNDCGVHTIAQGVTDPVGNLSLAFVVPDYPGGVTYTVAAAEPANGFALWTSFNITAALTLSPASGRVGTSVTAQGTGFVANETVNLSWAGSTLASAVATAAGNFSVLFAVPGGAAGPTEVVAAGSTGDSASATFEVTPPASYSVTFTETGLPSGTQWWVNVTGEPPLNSTTDTLQSSLPNGTYAFAIGSSNKTWAAPNGTFAILGAPVSVIVAFHEETHLFAFYAEGLPEDAGFNLFGWAYGAGWSQVSDVLCRRNCDGLVAESGGALNGSYPYLMSGPAGYRLVGMPGEGNLTTTGATSVTFQFVRGTTYKVGFSETGLAKGTSWCVEFGWTSCSSTRSMRAGTIFPIPELNLTPGKYAYTIEPVGDKTVTATIGRTVVPASGILNLTHSTNVVVAFSYPYLVTFVQTGLTSGTWSITVKGHTETAAWDSPIEFDLANGSYAYRIGEEAGYKHAGSPSRAVVNGAPASVTVSFRAT
jgi:hypothetical protein